MHMNKAMRVT